jgi:hypothetical protein
MSVSTASVSSTVCRQLGSHIQVLCYLVLFGYSLNVPANL